MPVDLPDFESLKNYARNRKFRQPHEGETEAEFREAFAEWTDDPLERVEIRSRRGWDTFNSVQKTDALIEQVGGTGELLKLFIGMEKAIEEMEKEREREEE